MKGVEKELSAVTGMLLLLTEVLGSECTHPQSGACALLHRVPFSPCIFDLHVHTSRCQFICCNKCLALLSDVGEAGGCACGQGACGSSLYCLLNFVVNLKPL